MSLVKMSVYIARGYNLGKPSIDDMSEFMSTTDERAKPKNGVEGSPSSTDLERVSRIAHIIKYKKTQYFFHREDKYIALYQDIHTNSGLVYRGAFVSENGDPSRTLPHGYGEAAYRYVDGYVYYAGYFYLGVPSGECRLSLEGKKSCYGTINSRIDENGDISMSFRSFEQ
jgi:hypothetical protein